MRKYILMHKNIETAVLLFSEEGRISKMPEILNSSHLPILVNKENNKNRIISEWWENRSPNAAEKFLSKVISIRLFIWLKIDMLENFVMPVIKKKRIFSPVFFMTE